MVVENANTVDLKELKHKAISGSIWSLVEKFSLQIVQFIVGIVLARLLGPEDFGLIAMTAIFIAISQVIADGGFEKTLIQSQHLTHMQINTAFYFNGIIGICIAGVLFLLAPAIADYFSEPQLKNILRVLSIGIPVDALGQTQRTLLMKELRFKKITIAQICSSLVTGIVGISMAYLGYGVWSLVISTLAGSVVWVGIYWIKSSWYPHGKISYASIAPLVPFGLNVLGSSLVGFFIYQFNNFIIGKVFHKSVLGLYSRGMKFPELTLAIIQSVVLKMSFPLFAKVQDNNEHLRRFLFKTNRVVALIAFPLLGFLFIDAREVVLFLLTDKWLGCVIFLKMFCIIKLFDPFTSIQAELLFAKGKAKLLFRLLIIASIVEIVPILIFVNDGVMYVVWIMLFSKIIRYFIYQWVISKEINVGMFEIGKWVLPYFFITIISVTLIWTIGLVMPASMEQNLLLKLVIDFLVGSFCYFILCGLMKMEELSIFKTVWGFLPGRMNKR